MARGEELPHPVKVFIVQRLACFDRETEVARAVKETFQLEVSRQRVQYYDPTSRLGASLAPELRALFQRARAAFLKEIDTIPIANKAVQLRSLDKALALAEQRGQIVMVIPLVEAAAKIAGTITNKHSHEHSGEIRGGPPISDTELDERIAEKCAQLGLAPLGAAGAGTADCGEKPAAEPEQASDAVPK